jgi:hypothetical protein
VSVTNGYLKLEQLKEAVGEDSELHDEAYERAIEAASRQIDEFRGDQFWLDQTPSARLFRAEHPLILWTGDFATPTGLTVATDLDGDGIYETVWATTDFSVEPLRRLNGRPFDRIIAVGDKEFPCAYARPTVQVTARWGWPAVPEAVEQACQILAIDHFKSKDLTGGVAGFSDLGPVRVAAFNPQARALLMPYKLP